MCSILRKVLDPIMTKILDNACTTHQHLETLFTEVKKGNTSINVGVLYRPPNSIFKDFIDELYRESCKDTSKKSYLFNG